MQKKDVSHEDDVRKKKREKKKRRLLNSSVREGGRLSARLLKSCSSQMRRLLQWGGRKSIAYEANQERNKQYGNKSELFKIKICKEGIFRQPFIKKQNRVKHSF